MGKHYAHLQQADRDRIKALHDDGYSLRKIARTVGIPHCTISRELRRNARTVRTRHGPPGSYEPLVAQQKAYVRRHEAKYQGMKIEQDQALRSYIIEGLRSGWNPDEISGHMKVTHQPFYASKTAIYDWLYSSPGQPWCRYLPSRQYKPRKRPAARTRRVMIPDRIPLSARPAGAANRSRYGHWEGDTVVSGKKTGSTAALAVVIERKTRLVRAQLIPNLRPESFAIAATSMLDDTRPRTLTLDNGIENKQHQAITAATGARAYFTDPYSSWQKGSVEHANKLLRAYLPKGCDLSHYDQAYVDAAVARLNKKPRRCLGYRSALELAEEKGVITWQR